MRKLLLALLGLLGVSVAFAADMPTKSSVVAIVPAQMLNWNGLYTGIVMGYGWKDENSSIAGQDKVTSGFIQNGLAPGSVNMRADGPMIGEVIGYDWQFGKIVAGVVGDWSWASLRGTGSGSGNLLTRTEDEKISQFGTIRGRVGYLVTDHVLLYGTAGGAWAKINSTISTNGQLCLSSGIVCMSGANSETRWGGVFGGGAELRMDKNWSLTGEALFAQLGSHDTVINGSYGYGKYATPISAIVAQNVNVGLIRAALTYRY